MPQRRTRMSTEQTLRLLECFVAGTPARQAAELAGVNRNTARLCYHHLRETIAHHLGTAEPWQIDSGPGELNSGWPGSELPGAPLSPASSITPAVISELLRPHMQGDYQVVPLAGLVEHAGHVQVVSIPGPAQIDVAGTPPPLPLLDAVVCVDEAVDDTTPALERQGRLHIVMREDIGRDSPRYRTIRSFWRKSANLLRRYNGVPRQRIFLYLKECEWRFSDGSHEASLATLRAWFAPLH